jgi:hypothetical protein
MAKKRAPLPLGPISVPVIFISYGLQGSLPWPLGRSLLAPVSRVRPAGGQSAAAKDKLMRVTIL